MEQQGGPEGLDFHRYGHDDFVSTFICIDTCIFFYVNANVFIHLSMHVFVFFFIKICFEMYH